jgi:hypothetical protein
VPLCARFHRVYETFKYHVYLKNGTQRAIRNPDLWYRDDGEHGFLMGSNLSCRNVSVDSI